VSHSGHWFYCRHDRHFVTPDQKRRIKHSTARVARRDTSELDAGIDELLAERRGAARLDGKFVTRDLRVRS
jgi:hypothetical protein